VREVSGVEVYDSLEELVAPEHTALVVVDMQNDGVRPDGWFASQGRPVDAVGEIVPRVQEVLSAARAAGVFVVFLAQTTLPDNASDPSAWLRWKVFDGRTRTDYHLEGSWGQQLLEEMGRRPDEPVIKKFRQSGFHETNLDTVLRTRGIETVVNIGITTQGCLMGTVMDAAWHNYFSVVVPDCVQSYNAHMHDLALEFMATRYDSPSSTELIEAWASAVHAGQHPAESVSA
jgi:ureidoacrylate peracid hydrolase